MVCPNPVRQLLEDLMKTKQVSLALVALLAVLTSGAGATVYTFDKDTAGKSNCGGGCLAAWPVTSNCLPQTCLEAPNRAFRRGS